ncbi:MAG: TetR/AcrR family transcriptional regulator [Polaromonas sp.]|uniref:TetR/AcrR family transcriptional regulator n=1 Tax=Polaromonas sp. TaxID=1869339 RepID=UPI0027352B08|nr:TetR/AcrR family transcriptional regulator [Polaromonas sp.]MDP2817285.1 TetR/AcrR family transcriptional regulator [Polaromonas sp.]
MDTSHARKRSAVGLPAASEVAVALPDKRPRGRPRKTVAERDDGNRRVELVHAAARLFRRKGFDGTSTRDIATAVGMHSGSPFYHFKSKGALLYAVMDEGMRSATLRQTAALELASAAKPDAAALLRVLVRNHFDILLGPGSDFIPVMLYESRSITARQRTSLAKLQSDYESVWQPVLQALSEQGRLGCPVKLARLLIFGALNWSAQWFDAKKGASLDELTDAAIALFIGDDPKPPARRVRP